ncbi:MAG: hypothetical protein JWN53_1549 [Gemmatimonadetes bacterium]|nr:hypothetical protein [Gemmatimonadota bacterium]
MQAKQNNKLETLHHIQAFLVENTARLPRLAGAGILRSFDEAVTEISTLAQTQAGGGVAAQGTTRQHRTLRDALVRDHMAPVATIAAVALPSTPELAPLRLPRSRMSAANLALAAHAMADTAEQHQAVFVAAGLPADFGPQLGAAADAMMESLRHRSQTVSVRRGATTSMNARFLAARKVVSVIDRFVRSDLKDQPVLLASWRSVTQVRRTPRPTVVSPEPVTASVATAPTETATLASAPGPVPVSAHTP